MNYLSLAIFVATIYCLNAAVPNLKLNDGHEIPQIGLGTWQMNGAQAKQAVKDALEIGYRHIVTASDYNNEKEVGEGLAEQIKAGIVKREDVFVSTKVWPHDSREKSLAEVKESLQKLNLTYVDLVEVHFPWGDFVQVYKGLEDALSQKLTRSIGVSNFNNNDLDKLLAATTVKPVNNELLLNPIAKEDAEVEHNSKLGITVTAYSPLGTGKFVNNADLAKIGAKYNKTAAQVTLRWAVQRGVVVIPKSVTKKYIKENFEIFDFTLTEDEMKAVRDVKTYY